MSQEQPPIRSRRELRQARGEGLEANQEPGTAGTRRVADGTVADGTVADGAGATERSGSERSSQVRARDRAALRTIKELAEKEGHLATGGEPTRRQLRLLQLAAETAPATAAQLIVPAPPRTRANPVGAQPGAGRGATPVPGEDPAVKDSAAKEAARKASKTPGQDAGRGMPGPGGRLPEGMTVEQALAARELLQQQAHNQLAKMEHIAATDPDAVDPAVLAEQIALAERAAVLNRRAAAKQKLAEQNGPPAPLRNGPSTASNLAMVTPLEFVEVPGVEQPVMKRPATSYVPVVTNPSPRVETPRKSGGRRPASSRPGNSGPTGGRAGVLARAEAAARGATGAASSARASASAAAGNPAALESEGNFAGRAPVAANAAYGLDPLDAATAGLGRARNLRLLQLAVLILGVLALIAGITLIIAGLAS